MGIEAGVIGTAALLGLGGWGATSLAMGGGKKASAPSAPAAPAMPDAPMGAEATSAEKARIRKKSKTLLSAPLSGGEYYGSPAPTLLGTGDSTKKTTLG